MRIIKGHCGPHLTSNPVASLVSISSTFYVRIFCTKVCSKPNSKQSKDFCMKNVRLKRWWNWQLKNIHIDNYRTIVTTILRQQTEQRHRQNSGEKLTQLVTLPSSLSSETNVRPRMTSKVGASWSSRSWVQIPPPTWNFSCWYSVRRLIGSRIIESAAYCNKR